MLSPRFKVRVPLPPADQAAKDGAAMKLRRAGVEIQQLDGNRYAVVVDGIVRYVGAVEECRRRATILAPKASDRDAQARALGRLRELI
jgi:hypothetical protein